MELVEESGATMDMTDKEDWEGTRREEEGICLILPQQSAVSTPRQGGTENTQDAEPDGVDVAIDTPRAGEDAQRSGGQNKEPDTGTYQRRRWRETKIGSELETTQTQLTQCTKHQLS